MRIYCTRQECISQSPWLVGYAFLMSALYSHTPPKQSHPILYNYKSSTVNPRVLSLFTLLAVYIIVSPQFDGILSFLFVILYSEYPCISKFPSSPHLLSYASQQNIGFALHVHASLVNTTIYVWGPLFINQSLYLSINHL